MSYGGVEEKQIPAAATFNSDGSAVYTPIIPTTNTISAATAADNLAFHQYHNQLDVQSIPPQQQHQQQQQQGSGGIGGGLNINTEPGKRKRGRPRKYSPAAAPGDDNFITITSPFHSSSSPSPSTTAIINQNNNNNISSNNNTIKKKARGRPPGSKPRNHQFPAFGSAGVGFTPHVITVKAGEDVLSRIMSFSQNGPRAVCILSANGAISNVTLYQAATSGGTVTYEGRFEILSLSGSFLLSENSGQRSRMGGLSVSLAGPDGRVLGGGVAGLLTAASSVQVIAGSFIAEDRKESKLGNRSEILTAPLKRVLGASAAGSPPSRATLSESSGGLGSPPNQSTGACNNSNPQGILNMPWK